MKIGVNTWVWTSPLTIEEFTRLAAHIKGLGFDLVEVPIESTSDLDYTRAAAVAREHGLAVSVCAAMSPDRDLIHPDESIRANGMAYVRHCIEAAYTLGSNRVCGPLYAAVGRTWQATPDERAQYMDLLVAQLKELSVHASDHGVVLGGRAAQPLRDERAQPDRGCDRPSSIASGTRRAVCCSTPST